MKIEFKNSFAKDLKKIRNKKLLKNIRKIIEEFEKVRNISDINGLKKLKADGDYYRIRLGDYRIGLIIKSDLVIFVRTLHRKEVYRYFP